MLTMVAVVDELITAEPCARNRGIVLDTLLSLNDHRAKVCVFFFSS